MTRPTRPPAFTRGSNCASGSRAIADSSRVVALLVRAVFVGAVLAACAEVPGNGAAERAEAADIGAAADGGAVPADAVHVMGTSESLSRVVDMVRLDDGTVWVLNQSEPYFLAFDEQGEVVRSWGRRGGGPAEFRSPATLVVGPAGDVWVHDRAPHALIRVSGEESEPARIVIPRDSLPPNRLVVLENLGLEGRTWLSAAAGGFMAARAKPTDGVGRPLYGADILSIRDDGTVRVLMALGDHMGGPAPEFENATLFVPNPLWAICPDATLALYDPLQNSIRRLTLDGSETQAAVTLPEERRVEVTADRVFGLMYPLLVVMIPAAERPDSAILRAGFEADFDEARAEMSTVFPQYADVQCTTGGTIWLQPFDADGPMGRGSSWLRISGEETRRVRLPDNFTPFRFTADRVYGVVLGEYDIPSIAWVAIG